MSVKIALPTIPAIELISLTDKVLVSYGTSGAARLVELDALRDFLGGGGADDSYRFREGLLQIWDPVAYANDNTKPWRALVCNDGVLGVSAPMD